MMLRYSFQNEEAAKAVDDAIEKTLAKGIRTADIVEAGQRPYGCFALAQEVADRVGQQGRIGFEQ